jgi:DNA-binding LytR/AlgR family response regulator
MKAKMEILLVEDEILVYRDLVRFFEKKGYGVSKHPEKKIIDNYNDAAEVLDTQSPDIAVLDIQIKGEKNGLELAEYIIDNFWIPVILFTGHNTAENRVIAGLINANAYVVKAGKPLNKIQLEADLDRLRKMAETIRGRKTLGGSFRVSQFFKATKMKSDHQIQKMILWEDILYIESNEDLKHNILICLADNTQWTLHEKLYQIEEKLPPFFTRFNKAQIVNVKRLEKSAKSELMYFIRGAAFHITPVYEAKALAVIRIFFRLL